MTRKSGLGRGLSSLIPPRKKPFSEDVYPVNYFTQKDVWQSKLRKDQDKEISSSVQGQALEIEPEKILPNPYQPRKLFNPTKLQELADSIKKHGILQPLVVTSLPEGKYELIAGERRLEAGKLAGLKKVPVILKKADAKTKLELALIENIQRHNLNPIEEARAYQQLIKNFSLTQEEASIRLGKSRPVIANALRLLALPDFIQKAIIEEKISEGHARALLAVSNPEKQKHLFEKILQESLTVRETEKLTRETLVSAHTRKTKEIDPQINNLEEQLKAYLGTKVYIKKKGNKGQLTIEFYSSEELGEILKKIINNQ